MDGAILKSDMVNPPRVAVNSCGQKLPSKKVAHFTSLRRTTPPMIVDSQ